MKFASGAPFTEKERARCARIVRRRIYDGLKRARLKRAATPSGAKYDQPGTPASRRLQERIMGEREDVDSTS